MDELILTMDAGTTGVKCAAFDRNGSAQFSCTEGYQTYYPYPGWAEQNPEEQLAASVRCARNAVEKLGAKRICALVFTGTMNGCIPVDKKGEALCNNIIHSDGRTEKQVESLKRCISMEEYYLRTGNRIDVHSGLPKYMWLKENLPEVYEKTWRFVNIKDYLYGHYTGCPGRTDFSDGSLCNCIDITKPDWAWDVLQDAEIDRQKMPELCKSTDVSGRVNRQYAEITGLEEGIPVAIGGGDGACAANGARAHAAGSGYMNIGSSAWISAASKEPILDKNLRLFNYYDLDSGLYNVCGAVQTGAAALNWAVENLIYPGSSVKSCNFAALEEEAKAVPAGSEGLFFMPTLMGERTPWWTPKIAGMLIGFSLYHTHSHIIRAVYEGIMEELHMSAEIFRENGVACSSLTMIGGGACSNLWGQMAASMLNAEIEIHATPKEATSLGAAFAAGVGIGWYKDFAEASSHIKRVKKYVPDRCEAEKYSTHYQVFRQLYPLTREAHELIYEAMHPAEGSLKNME